MKEIQQGANRHERIKRAAQAALFLAVLWFPASISRGDATFAGRFYGNWRSMGAVEEAQTWKERVAYTLVLTLGEKHPIREEAATRAASQPTGWNGS